MKKYNRVMMIWINLLLIGALFSACVPAPSVPPASGGTQPPAQPAQGTADPGTSPDSGPILIGAALCLTGTLGFADGPALQGAQLAVDDLNSRGGVLGRKLELANLDCKSDPVTAGSVTEQLIQQGARAIITPGDYYFGASSSRAAQKAGLVGISTTASSPLFGSKTLGDKQFTISMWNTTMGAAAAEYAYKTRAWRSVYVIKDRCCDYSNSLARYFSGQFKKLGGEVLNEDTFMSGEKDFSAQLKRIQTLPKPPDFFYFSCGMPELSLLIHTIRAAGINSPVLGGDSYDDPALFQALGPADGNEIYYVTHTYLAAGVTPEMAHFLDLYRAKYHQEPNGLVAPGWDVVMILAQAMEKAGSTDGAAIAKVMESTQFGLLTGQLKWSAAEAGHVPDIEGAMVKLDQAVPKFVGWVRPADVPAP